MMACGAGVRPTRSGAGGTVNGQAGNGAIPVTGLAHPKSGDFSKETDVHEDTVSLGQALRLHPELHRIFDLGRIGWVGQRLNIDGEPALVFRYNWPHHIDALWIFDRTRCLALRSVDDAPGMV